MAIDLNTDRADVENPNTPNPADEKSAPKVVRPETKTRLVATKSTAAKAHKSAAPAAKAAAPAVKAAAPAVKAAAPAAKAANAAAPAAKAAAPAAKAAAPAAKAAAPAAKSAASMFKELIMAGKLTDDQIFAEVQRAFSVADSKRSYVGWYRNHLAKEGHNPPGPVEAGKTATPNKNHGLAK